MPTKTSNYHFINRHQISHGKKAESTNYGQLKLYVGKRHLKQK